MTLDDYPLTFRRVEKPSLCGYSNCFRPFYKMRGFMPCCEHHYKHPEKWGKDGQTFTGSGFKKVEKPSEDVCNPLRHIVVAVMLDAREPLQVNQIRTRVQTRLRELAPHAGCQIPRGLRYAGHNTIERRINECADPRLWTDGPPPLVHVGEAQSPWYALNPDRFPEVAK